MSLLPEYADRRVHTACGSPVARPGPYTWHQAGGEWVSRFEQHTVGHETDRADPHGEHIVGEPVVTTDYRGRSSTRPGREFYWHRHHYVCHHCGDTLPERETRPADGDWDEVYYSCHA